MAGWKGGEKLSAHLTKMANAIATGRKVRVGFLENATYPNGTPIAMVAAIQEFCAPKVNIPPRPYFRNMITAKSPEWPGAIAGLLRTNGYDARRVLTLIGEGIKMQLVQSIHDTNSPPLKDVTLMLRKMKREGKTITRRSLRIAYGRLAKGESVAGVPSKPLVETADMINSVDFEVK